MTFTSISFFVLFFLTYVALLVIDYSKNIKKCVHKPLLVKHIVLLVSSYIFYGWWDYRFCVLMAFLSMVSWYCAKNIEINNYRKLFSLIGIVTPLVVLAFFKYFNFFVDSFCDAFNVQYSGTLNIILPVGISFYTFQSMSYTIDVIRGNIKTHSLLEVILYVSFFPQLVAGPIIKASDFMPQLQENRKLNLNDLSVGIQMFVFGLFKKVVIADNLSVFVDNVFEKPLAFSSITVILAVISYSIQIYCDFSGYSDMAIGTARCLGYHFRPNFNLPYISKNVTEFWKRWHISLSSWLQEYLYIPLGGNRKGIARTYINLLLTMLLGGLWHGANYTFILWGGLHGIALCVHKIYRKHNKHKRSTAVGTILCVLGTYVFVCICWVFFRAENFKVAFDVLFRVFVWQDGITQIFSWTIFSVVVIAIATLIAIIKSQKEQQVVVNGYYKVFDLNKIPGLVALFVTIMLIICLAYTNSNPFIYFQF